MQKRTGLFVAVAITTAAVSTWSLAVNRVPGDVGIGPQIVISPSPTTTVEPNKPISQIRPSETRKPAPRVSTPPTSTGADTSPRRVQPAKPSKAPVDIDDIDDDIDDDDGDDDDDPDDDD